MAYQRLQPTRSLAVIPEDGLLLPGGPGSRLDFGAVDGVLAGYLVNTATTISFNQIITAGDTVYNLVTGEGARVTGVQATQLRLSKDIFTAVGEFYIVGSVVKGGGATIWSGSGGVISGKTAGGDDITLTNVPAGTMLPILMSVINQTGTTATNMYAFW